MRPIIENLPNKLKVLVTPVLSVGSATALVLVAAGSRYENKKNNGVAHFAEHMFFKGTKRRSSALEISSVIDGIGGEFNAFTSREYTGFYVKSSSKYLSLALDVLSDMLLHSKFEDAEIDRERGVILEELRMNRDAPMRHISDVFEELLYADQPLGWNIVGSVESLKNIKRDDFLSYLDTFYRPTNMVVSISGKVEKAGAKLLVDKYFGEIKNKETKRFLPVEDSQKSPAVRLVSKETEQGHFCLGVRAYRRGHPNRYKLAVLNTILGTSMSSRLFIQLRERRGLAYYVRSAVEEYHDAGFFVVQAGVEIKKIEEAIKVTLEELGKLSEKLVSEEELKKAKEYIKGKLILELEDSREVAGMFGAQLLLEGKIRTPQEIMEKVDAVKPSDIQNVAYDIFKSSSLNLAIIGPYKDEEKFGRILTLS